MSILCKTIWCFEKYLFEIVNAICLPSWVWTILCLSRKQWKCINLVNTVNWLDFPVKNESKIALMRYFPLYNFRISFIKLKLMAKLEFLLLRSNFWFLWMFTCIHSYNWSELNIFKNMCKVEHPNAQVIIVLCKRMVFFPQNYKWNCAF